MLIYRSDADERDGRAVWQEVVSQAASLTRDCDHDAAVAFLIALGEAESAIADRLFPDRDGVHPVAAALRVASLAAAHVVLASASHQRTAVGKHLVTTERSLAAVPADALPETLSMAVSEGYAYYALHPEAYAEAARRFLAESRPSIATVIGIRSIGTSLAAMVAAQIQDAGIPVQSCSVRPRGHPFDRRVEFDPALASLLRTQPRGTVFLVADEGPGLSGSSFAAVVTALTELGVGAADIVLFPSSNPDGSAFKSPAARAIWQRQQRYCVEPDVRPHSEPAVIFRWRELLYASEAAWPATHPHHERVKWVLPASPGADERFRATVRFAGLGRYGNATQQRADTLAAHGLGPASIALRNGYLTLPFVEGRPCTPADASALLIDTLATHVAALVRLFPRARRPDLDAVQHMLETNVRLTLGDAWLPAVALSDDERRALEESPCAAVDGRMLTHEWLRTPAGFVKTDALDHHADHFFPGTQDAGWDLAAAAIELNLGPDGRERLVDAYIRASADRDVGRRLAFHERAYLAFRLGYATMARDTLAGTPEAARFDRLVHFYSDRLQHALARRRSPSTPSHSEHPGYPEAP